MIRIFRVALDLGCELHGHTCDVIAEEASRVTGDAGAAREFLALLADASFTVVAAGAGPFDSHVATLALLNAMVTAVADKLRSSATDRHTWRLVP